MLRRIFAFLRGPSPLTGAPATPRLKIYSAQSGYVYHYYYEGRRALGPGAAGGTEFVFRVSADRKSWLFVPVRLAEAALAGWQAAHARSLSPTERYAIAKLALFQAFVERAPERIGDAVRVRAADLDGIVATLGFEP
jgi:hypothetical protein